jgi:hypothetical protein
MKHDIKAPFYDLGHDENRNFAVVYDSGVRCQFQCLVFSSLFF